ncbi:IclR family transcriptional regulator [Simiduia agarivorans]|uniref:IclR family transcriptional regulator n=1 Tax=Simiduia agarivorans (strain DSM 21679 / JCM 13881 / BCRC 17597 / SA1) TaxID=1117647 RepID=K4L2S7_SIMAS|nr:IclR family transcriptional regulator [Simiduia agarivorans]AFV00503.1 IclR family transcriptional regulator [Simiduia agarivorans SA1 = DSM 21679]
MSDASPKYAVPALDKGFEILEFLAGDRVPRSQAEIAQGVGRKPSEIFRVLVGLEARGYLVREEVSGKYRTSLKLLGLARSLQPLALLRQQALPIMEALASRLGHSCHLSMRQGDELMVVLQAPSPGAVSLAIAEGTRFPLLPTASGRVLMAHLPEAESADLLSRLIAPEQRDATAAALAELRSRGHELSQSRLTDGVTDCAVLVGARQSPLMAVLAVSCLTSVMDKRLERAELIAEVSAAAADISARIGL